MKVLFSFIFFFYFFLFSSYITNAQTAAQKDFAKDTTPIEDLDYHLSKAQFMYYYGTDDTAKAIINMFYRKRGIGILDFFVYPVACSALGDLIAISGESILINGAATTITSALIIGGAGISLVGLYGFPIYYLIQRSNYSRQKLIYTLVGRERGMGIPNRIYDNLRSRDFQ